MVQPRPVHVPRPGRRPRVGLSSQSPRELDHGGLELLTQPLFPLLTKVLRLPHTQGTLRHFLFRSLHENFFTTVNHARSSPAGLSLEPGRRSD